MQKMIRYGGLNGIRNTALLCLIGLTILLIALQMLDDFHVMFRTTQTQTSTRRFPMPVSDHCKTSRLNGSGDVEDLLSMSIPKFEENYKNPCFYETCNSLGSNGFHQLRCLPYFHVLGIDKSGSTDLFYRIIAHPQILGNDGVVNKETMWWSWKRYGQWLKKQYDLHINETLEDYLRYFDSSTSLISKYIGRKGHNDNHEFHPIVTGDGTPMDFWDFSGWPMVPQNQNKTEPSILTPHLMKHINPNVKLIIILRDPTERLYSDYLFLELGPQSALAFAGAVNSSLEYFYACSQKKGDKLCLYDRALHLAVEARIHVSIYSVYLKEWLKVFPREQILILRNEDYAKDLKGHMKKVFKFLDVVDLSEKELDNIATMKRAYKTAGKKISGPMFRYTRNMLDKFFEKYKKELAEMLNDERFLWSDQPKVEKDYRRLKLAKGPRNTNKVSKRQSDEKVSRERDESNSRQF